MAEHVVPTCPCGTRMLRDGDHGFRCPDCNRYVKELEVKLRTSTLTTYKVGPFINAERRRGCRILLVTSVVSAAAAGAALRWLL